MSISRSFISYQTMAIVIVLAVALFLGYQWIDREEVTYSNYSKDELEKYLKRGYNLVQINESDSALAIYSMPATAIQIRTTQSFG